MRIVIADDNLFVREGIAAVLRDGGVNVVAQASAAPELLAAVDTHRPDVAIVDIRMPPTHTDEGLQAAQELRARHPALAIVILSSTSTWARRRACWPSAQSASGTCSRTV